MATLNPSALADADVAALVSTMLHRNRHVRQPTRAMLLHILSIPAYNRLKPHTPVLWKRACQAFSARWSSPGRNEFAGACAPDIPPTTMERLAHFDIKRIVFRACHEDGQGTSRAPPTRAHLERTVDPRLIADAESIERLVLEYWYGCGDTELNRAIALQGGRPDLHLGIGELEKTTKPEDAALFSLYCVNTSSDDDDRGFSLFD